LHERLQAYMLKAAREAKLRTSWINPDLDYEAALERFVRESLAGREFREDVAGLATRLGRLGLLVGRSQALIKVASPGVPDYYQGTELWDFSLVDPDNRRPVDYGLRKKLLSRREKSPQDLLANLPDGQAKLFVIRKGLELRKKYPAVFHGGEYVPLYADAGREQNVCAFALRGGGRTIVAVAPRLFARLAEEGDAPLGRRAWGDAKLQIPDGAYTNVLTGERLDARAGVVALADLLSEFPVALLGRDETA
jgi:(1->4)-alpha-D-glucan 1-alpha-D-glucosylmutase